MREVVQDMRHGKLRIADIPQPIARPGTVAIMNVCSVVSAGTEKSILDMGRSSLLGKARKRPDEVRRVLQKVRQEGLLTTWEQIKKKLEAPATLGYSSAGIVIACGEGVQNFKPGDRVASNGPHGEVVSVPKHLCARIPDDLSFEHAAFTVLGAISLQGVRLAKVSLGETVLVIGLGLLGQIAVAILSAAGCHVLGTDPDEAKCELALKMGAVSAKPAMRAEDVEQRTSGMGADAVVITAATSSNQPIELSMAAVRKRGRIVLVGVIGLEFDRRPMFFKEAEFIVSCSYGPGRYDPEYEDQGHDYPYSYVRWTEQRNLQAVLDLMATGRLDVAPLISHHFAIEDAEKAYEMITENKEPFLGILLDYPGIERERAPFAPKPSSSAAGLGVACLGAGQFAQAVLIPAIKQVEGVRPRVVCSAGGLSAAHAADKNGFESATSNEEEVYKDSSVGAVFILTQHNLHAEQVIRALAAGKHVFVEKPLAITLEEMSAVEDALEAAQDRHLMVGFNRRFAPATTLVKKHFQGVAAPLAVSVRFNAGEIPADHWTQSDETGGGRIIGEACHAIDLATALTGSPVTRVFAESIGGPNAPQIRDDQCFITMRHANGSVSSVAYLAGGDKAFPKERVEVIGGGRVAVIEDWRTVSLIANGSTERTRLKGQDKGHRAGVRAFLDGIRAGGQAPIPWSEVRATSLASILAVRSLREGVPFDVS